MDLTAKKAIVTGGVRGIGRAIVERLTAQGALVAVVDVDAAALDTLQQEMSGVRGLRCDLTDYEQVVAAVDTLYDEFSAIDLLVNNAGIIHSAPLVALTPSGIAKHDVDAWHHVINTDLTAVFYMTVNVVEKMMLRRTKGVIVNVSSVAASGNAGQSAYSAAKAGVNALTTTWAKELAILGIRVVGIAPGFTDTPSTHDAMTEQLLQKVVKQVPARRLGRVEEVADAVVAAVENDFFNGKVLAIDGGLVL